MRFNFWFCFSDYRNLQGNLLYVVYTESVGLMRYAAQFLNFWQNQGPGLLISGKENLKYTYNITFYMTKKYLSLSIGCLLF